MSKPVFVFVPGAWHRPEIFNLVIKQLDAAGYKSIGVTLPSVGAEPPPKGFEPDVNAVRTALRKVLDSGEDVILVMHSYGSMPACEATKGVSGKGKIRRLVYCCSFVLPEGGSLLHTALGGQLLPWFMVDGDYLRPENPRHVFYNDMSNSDAETWVNRLAHHSLPSFSSQLTVAPWKTIPSTYILCEEDQAIPIHAQEAMVAGAKQAAPDSFDVVERCNAGHSPFLSMPNKVAEYLKRAAGAT